MLLLDQRDPPASARVEGRARAGPGRALLQCHRVVAAVDGGGSTGRARGGQAAAPAQPTYLIADGVKPAQPAQRALPRAQHRRRMHDEDVIALGGRMAGKGGGGGWVRE